jgi:hypothetical protein
LHVTLEFDRVAALLQDALQLGIHKKLAQLGVVQHLLDSGLLLGTRLDDFFLSPATLCLGSAKDLCMQRAHFWSLLLLLLLLLLLPLLLLR